MLLASPLRWFSQRSFSFGAAFIVLISALCGQTPSAADGFNPDINGNVFAVVTQPDGKVIVGGQFSVVGNEERNNIVRLNPDGSVDRSFNPNANGPVRAILLQPDNRIVIGGDFSELRPHDLGPVISRGRLARLNADGSVDNSLAVNIGGEPLTGGDTLRSQVFALARQADGSLVVGGSFGTVQPGNLAVIFNRQNLFRVTSAGALDLAYEPNPNGPVLALAVHVDNTIVAGGGFTSFAPANGSAITRNRIARLNPNGTVDSEFDPNANNGVSALAVQRDGKILVGGFFTTLQSPAEDGPASRIHIARLNIDGTLDADFFPRAEGNVYALSVAPDGSILVGGSFSTVWGRGTAASSRSNVARFNPDGSLDAQFAPTFNAQVDAIATQPDGRVIVGGHFTRAQPQGTSTALFRNHLARLNQDGAIDSNFALDPGGRILVSVTQTDGRMVVAGTFTSIGGATHNYVARLNADGTVDPTYGPNFNGRVYSLAYEPASGKVIAGGAFTNVDGESRNHIARLNPSGTLDSDFNPNIDGQVGVVLLQPDGRILVGGTFTSVQPVGAATTTPRSNILRLNANGTLDTGFDPSVNSSVSAITLQPDGKILVGGLFSAVAPGLSSNNSAAVSTRNSLARFNADGTLDTGFSPNPNGQVSTIVVQPDNKIVIGGAFTGMAPPGATALTTRNHLARINADGTIDADYDPNVDGNVLAAALQPDGKLLIGGSFITLQPGGAEAPVTLRMHVARLNADGTVDAGFDLGLDEVPGNRVDSLRVLSDGRVLIGGSFNSLQPAGTPTRIARKNFARLTSNGTVDTTFEPSPGGSTGAVVNGFAILPDGKVLAVGSFSDLGGAKSTNIARFLAEGNADTTFSNTLTTDGPVNAVAIRPNSAPVPTQLAGFAWLNANGTLRPSFNATTRLSGEVNAIVVEADGRVLLGGSFANLNETTAGNLVRFNANGTLDTSFNPAPNGTVTGISIQPDGRLVIVGAFTTVGGAVRNRIARIDSTGALDTTFDPNVNGRINAVVTQSNGQVVIGGAFTSLTPNLSTTPVTRNFIARINTDGSLDANYDPNPNFNVNALALHPDGKVIAGGAFTAVQANSAAEAVARNAIARFNTDGSLDQNFNPNANGVVNVLIAAPNEQVIAGGSFTTAGGVFTRNNLFRINTDGSVDDDFDPNPNGAVTTLALQSDGTVLVGGNFTTLQPAGTPSAVARHNLARINPNGSLDLNFNPDLNGAVSALATRPDGSALIGGRFTAIQLNGSILIGGNFATAGGVPARNLASLNDDGSINANFQPRPDGAVNAILVQPDGKVVVGGAFTNIAGAARSRIARFNADGTLDTAFNPGLGEDPVAALALLPDGRIMVSGSTPARANVVDPTFARLNANGSIDTSFSFNAVEFQTGGPLVVRGDGSVIAILRDSRTTDSFVTLGASGGQPFGGAGLPALAPGSVRSLAAQADGRIIVSGSFPQRILRLNADGSLDASFNPAINGPVTAVALQADGRVLIGGGFTDVAGQARVGIARLGPTEPAVQSLGVAANGAGVIWNRGGTAAGLSAVIFEISSDRFTWERLGDATRAPGSGSNWQLTGVTLPESGVFYIRARGLVPSAGGRSSGIVDAVREFNFANPVAGATGVIAQAITPSSAAFPATTIDPVTGIAARSTVMMVPGEGSVEIVAASATTANAANDARLVNLSTRGRVSADNPLILGFAISGSDPRPVLVRAIGPALRGFGVADALPATRLEVYDEAGVLMSTNEGWGDDAALFQAATATGAFPLTRGSADSAALLTLAPGNYTIQVIDLQRAGGVALAEIYDAGSGAGSRLVNVSTRGAAGSGGDALISGFVIAGADAAQRVLLRGVGPGLAKFGETGAALDPSVALFDAKGRALGTNDNWVSSVDTISTAAIRAGAFPLDRGSRDAAVLATLPSGAYTIQVSAGGSGAALLEIYEVR